MFIHTLLYYHVHSWSLQTTNLVLNLTVYIVHDLFYFVILLHFPRHSAIYKASVVVLMNLRLFYSRIKILFYYA